MKQLVVLLVAVFFCLSMTFSASADDDIPVIQKEELKEKLGSADILILDVRSEKQWEESEFKIPGAVWYSLNSDMELPQDKTIITYCACNGLGASGRVATELIDQGFSNVYALQGGWNAWNASDFPLEER